MKRTRLQRSSTRARDTPSSLAIREQYRIDNPSCELTRMLARLGIVMAWSGDRDSIQVHHLWAGQRVDVVSNLISVSPAVHGWLHANPSDGLLCCLIVKHEKGETNADEFRRISGQYLAGWIANHPPKDERLMADYAKWLEAFPCP